MAVDLSQNQKAVRPISLAPTRHAHSLTHPISIQAFYALGQSAFRHTGAHLNTLVAEKAFEKVSECIQLLDENVAHVTRVVLFLDTNRSPSEHRLKTIKPRRAEQAKKFAEGYV